MNELRRVIGEVEFNLFYYANIYANVWTYEHVHGDAFPAKTREKIEKAEEIFPRTRRAPQRSAGRHRLVPPVGVHALDSLRVRRARRHRRADVALKLDVQARA